MSAILTEKPNNPPVTPPAEAGNSAHLPSLAALLPRHQEAIVTHWLGLIHDLPDSRVRNLPVEHFRTTLGNILRAIVEATETGTFGGLQAILRDLCGDRLQAGLESGEVIEAILLCTDAVLPVIQSAYPLDSAALQDLVAKLDGYERWMARYWADLYVAESGSLLSKQQARTRLMLDTAEKVSSTLEINTVLSSAASAISNAVGLPHCSILLVEDDPTVVDFRRAGTSDLPGLEMAHGARLADGRMSLQEVTIFTARVLTEKKPMVATDVLRDPRLRGTPFACKSVLGLPFLANDRVVAIAWVMTWDNYHVFSQEEIDLAQGIANVAALAIENARLYQKVKEQAIVEERERLAQELHDELSQTLGTLNWRLATLDRLLSAGDIDAARALLLQLKGIAKQGYAEVRDALFTLRSASSLESDFLPALQDYLAEYRTRHGLDVALLVDPPACPRFPIETRLQIIRIIQEALSNVRKHAGASRVQVTLRQDVDGTQLRIEDDGRGFDLGRQEQEDESHYGLSIMRQRAASVGGTLTIDSSAGAGTRIEIQLPVQAVE